MEAFSCLIENEISSKYCEGVHFNSFTLSYIIYTYDLIIFGENNVNKLHNIPWDRTNKHKNKGDLGFPSKLDIIYAYNFSLASKTISSYSSLKIWWIDK